MHSFFISDIVTCECYWPINEDVVILKSFQLKLLSTWTSEKNEWIVRKIKLKERFKQRLGSSSAIL